MKETITYPGFYGVTDIWNISPRRNERYVLHTKINYLHKFIVMQWEVMNDTLQGQAADNAAYIGTNSIVAAGAMVIRDVPEGTTAMEVPAREARG